MAANFCFNFQIPENDSEISMKEQPSEQKVEDELKKIQAEFLIPNEKELEVIFKGEFESQNVEIADTANGQSFRLQHLSKTYVEDLMQNSSEYSSSATTKALKSNTDLIPDIYEGGLKIWECSIDLVNYLNKLLFERKIIFQEKKVLELGCGAGLPGIYACLKGASVCFQDYNPEVIKIFTIPNVALNLNSVNSSNLSLVENMQSCRFLCGDWESAISILDPMSFDIILTSETIYNMEGQQYLYKLIKFSLNTSGVAFVAAKSYYFGVGGGIKQYIDLVQKDNVFNMSKVLISCDGVKREILQMERK